MVYLCASARVRVVCVWVGVGITGWVCDDRRGKELQEIVKLIPVERLMIETDAPYLFPRNAPVRRSRNEPQYLPYVLQKLSQCMGLSVLFTSFL